MATFTVEEWKQSAAPIATQRLASQFITHSESALRERFGDAFLLQRSANAGASAGATMTVTSLSDQPKHNVTGPVVYVVCSTERSAFSHFVSLGRTRNNDVVVDDQSISRFHALFIEQDGKLFLHDAGSHNGSFVNGRKAPAKGVGQPLPLVNGALLRFGNVELTFLSAEGLLSELRR